MFPVNEQIKQPFNLWRKKKSWKFSIATSPALKVQRVFGFVSGDTEDVVDPELPNAGLLVGWPWGVLFAMEHTLENLIFWTPNTWRWMEDDYFWTGWFLGFQPAIFQGCILGRNLFSLRKNEEGMTNQLSGCWWWEFKGPNPLKLQPFLEIRPC